MSFANFSRDGSKGLPPVLLQAVEQKEAFFGVFGGSPTKGSNQQSRVSDSRANNVKITCVLMRGWSPP